MDEYKENLGPIRSVAPRHFERFNGALSVLQVEVGSSQRIVGIGGMTWRSRTRIEMRYSCLAL